MKKIFIFNSLYFLLAMAILVIEILIAKFAHDQIIRPYIGDLLVVILIYCFVKSFLNTPVLKAAIAVLVFSYFVEVLQYFHLVKKLGLQHSPIAKIMIGTSFEWIDLVAYTFGTGIILYLENIRLKNRASGKAI